MCQELAQLIPADGEGATKLLTVHVTGARDDDQGRRVARAVASSSLVKAALHGADANWGRIVAAIGQAARTTTPETTSIRVTSDHGELSVLKNGEPTGAPRKQNVMDAPEVTFEISLGTGPGEGTAWGCDLTEDYVAFNAEYTT